MGCLLRPHWLRPEPAEMALFLSGPNTTGEIKNPFTVPDGVLAVMKTDPFVQENLRDQGIPSDQIPKSWFAASIVHLARSRESDVVLIGKGPLVGANVTQFWILRPTGHGYELLLQATGLVLSIKEGRLNGYRDISVGAATAVQVTTVLFRFDGHRYRAHRQSTIPIV